MFGVIIYLFFNSSAPGICRCNFKSRCFKLITQSGSFGTCCETASRWIPQKLKDEKSKLVQGLYSLSGKTSYRQISWSLEVARLDVAMVVSLWNLTGTSAALLPRYLPNFRAIGKVYIQISRLRDFMRSCGKMSYRLMNRGPGNDFMSSSNKPLSEPMLTQIYGAIQVTRLQCV